MNPLIRCEANIDPTTTNNLSLFFNPRLIHKNVFSGFQEFGRTRRTPGQSWGTNWRAWWQHHYERWRRWHTPFGFSGPFCGN